MHGGPAPICRLRSFDLAWVALDLRHGERDVLIPDESKILPEHPEPGTW
jgi:hypothetical protein